MKRLDYHKTITNFPEISLIAFKCIIFKEEEEDNENKSAAEQADHSEKVIS